VGKVRIPARAKSITTKNHFECLPIFLILILLV
jgi:hypothetical protein